MGVRYRRRGHRSGQALVVAVTIMFILLAVGLLFLRNALFHLQVTGVSNERIADLNYSRSGIDYVDHELMTSPIGADWRPTPRNLNPGGMIAGLPADPALAALDPDYQYLRPWAPTDSAPVQVLVYEGQPVMRSLMGPSGGFTRISFGQGRALIRVTYNPRNAVSFNGQNVDLPLSTDLPSNAKLYARGANGPWMEYGPTPLSQYIRIDSIGRFGDTSPLDNQAPPYTDPTSIVNAGINRPYRVQMVAYKAFGLGDHLLFVTNKEKEGGLFDIGYGSQAGFSSPTPYTLLNETPGSVAGDVGGQEIAGNIRINGSALWDGADVHLAPATLVGSGIDVAGSTEGTLSLNGTANPSQTTLGAPTGALFAGDLVRDNNWFNNAGADTARSVRRLQTPPLNLDRYRTLTRDSGGSGLWINNALDMQPPIPAGAVHSGQDIDLTPQSWFNPYNPPKDDAQFWDTAGNPGYVYNPPAVRMVFHHPLPAGTNDPDPFTTKYYFIRLFSESGTAYLDVYYTPDAMADANLAAYVSNPNGGVPATIVGDHTIMAEGNLSIHGDVAPGMTSAWWSNGLKESAQLVVVSRGTIYLDGSLTRAEDGSSTDRGIGNYGLGTLLVPSAVALLAEDHVALNLTATGTRVQPWDFNQPDPNLQADTDLAATDPDTVTPPGVDAPPSPWHWKFDINSSNATDKYFRLTFELPAAAKGSRVRLYLRHASAAVDTSQHPEQDTEVDAYLNPPPGIPFSPSSPQWEQSRIEKASAGTLKYPYNLVQGSITPLTQTLDGQDGKWEYASYQLNPYDNQFQPNPPDRLIYGGTNVIYVHVTGNTYYLSRVAVKAASRTAPEAVLNLDGAFLANEGSFYVIPKDFFYFNPAASIPPRQPDKDIPSGMPIDYSNGGPGNWAFPDTTYPDVNPFTNTAEAPLLQQISISGSLTLNKMAPAGDQAAWARYDPSPVSLDGITAPGPLYSFDDGLVDIALRQGSWLPIMPSLPMVPGLVFEGEQGPL